MRHRTRRIATAAALAASLILGAGSRAEDDAEGYGDGYRDGAYGRVRHAEGGASILRADGRVEDSDRAGLNAPIFPGDTLRTGDAQRVEAQLASDTLVRLDRGTSVVFQSMPDPYAKFQDNVVLVLQRGAVRVRARLGDREEFRVDTDSGSVYLLGEGDFRIESDGSGRTSVASLRGVAEVVGSQGSVLVRGGSRTTVTAGSDPAEPRAYSSLASDGFDRWCEIRDAAYQGARDEAVVQSDVPHEVQPYYSELSSYGTWTVVPDYGRVWYPNGVAAGWRPYYDGYWAYGPGGYFWVSYEPWGWAPYRYGSWQWVGSYGWCWAPGNVFAGAWVSWSWGSVYLGWAPLNYWGNPCWRSGGYYRYGYYDPDCWTFVNYDHAYATRVGRHAVPVSRVGEDLKTARMVTRAPRVPPSRLAVSADARAQAIREVSQDRAAAVRKTTGRPLGEMSQELLRRDPRAAAERATARVPERFPRRTLQDDRKTSAPVREGGRTTVQRTAPEREESAAPQGRTAPPRTLQDDRKTSAPVREGGRTTIDRSAAPRRPSVEPSRPQPRGNQRTTIQRTAPQREERAAPQDRTAPTQRAQPDSRSNVRELYERVSRPRVTRPSDAGGGSARVEPSRPRPQAARPQASKPSAPKPSAPKASAPKPSAPRSGGGSKAKPRGGGSR